MSTQFPKFSQMAPEYKHYLLRFSRDDSQSKWLIALQGSIGEPPKLFANLDDLYDFLQEILNTTNE